MKRTSVKTKVIALVLSVLIVFSAGSGTLICRAAAPNASPIPEAAYEAALALIRQYVPAGGAISAVIDKIVSSYTDDGPTLADISAEIAQLRDDLHEQFDEVKEQMKEYTQEIEDMITDQTVIAGKGIGFDKLMTALQATNRQIDAINNDSTLNDNEKAVEIAALIGKNDEWVEQDNLYFQYQDFINTMASSSFAEQQDRDLYQVVYDQFVPKVMFSGEAMDFSMPYIERVIFLGLYAYSINAQCLKAAQTISKFTDEDVATLNEDELNTYHNVKSLTSIVEAEIYDMHERMFDMSLEDSVMTHFQNYCQTNRNVYIEYGKQNKIFARRMLAGCFDTVGNESKFREIYTIMDEGNLSHDEMAELAAYVAEAYPGTSLRTFLTNQGFNLSNIPQDALISTGDEQVYYSEGYVDQGGIGFKFWYNFPSVSIDDTDLRVQDHDCFIRVTTPAGGAYCEVLSDATVLNFRNPLT